MADESEKCEVTSGMQSAALKSAPSILGLRGIGGFTGELFYTFNSWVKEFQELQVTE